MAQSFPSKLGRYQIVKHLANGGMAQVLLARATGIEGFERHVVVKRIHSDRAEDPVFVKMFLDEARLAAQLHHNNIVQVHDIGKEKGEYFFAMEYVHGEDLRKLLMQVNKKQEKVPFEHVVQIITTVALALHHAHEQRGPDRKPLGLVHRDVSPANIIVGYDGNVKVVDFGIAKAALRTQKEDTKAGSLKGKVSYMAPEQCAGQPIDRRSDVYSLGIVLFELCTVRRLFKGKNDFLTMSAIVQGQIPEPSSYRPDIPPELEAIILKALALDPPDRYQHADEMREALEQFAAIKGLRTSTGSLGSYMKATFGQRPEPWLVEDPTIELELTVDFDGSEAGAAKVSDSALQELSVPSLVEPTPSSPIVRARKKAATDGSSLIKSASIPGMTGRQSRPQLPPPSLSRKTPPSIAAPIVAAASKPPEKTEEQAKTALENLTVGPPADERGDVTPPVPPPMPLVPKDPVLPAKADAKPPKDDGWTNGSPTTGSGTPLAWPTDVTAANPTSTRKKLFAVGGVIVLAAVAALFVVMRNVGDDDRGGMAPAKVTEPSRVDPPPPPPVEAPKEAHVTPQADPTTGATIPPNIAAPTNATPTTAPTNDEPVASGSGSAVKKKKVVVKKKQDWTSDELFLPPKK